MYSLSDVFALSLLILNPQWYPVALLEQGLFRYMQLSRCLSDDLKSLSKTSQFEGTLNRMCRSANVRKHMRELRSELAEIEHLLKLTHTLQFPAEQFTGQTIDVVAEPEEKKKSA